MTFIHNPTGRRTPCHIVDLDCGTSLYFSYETLIAKRSTDGTRERLDNVWGPTTGRHMNEMGIRDWPVVDEISPTKVISPLLYATIQNWIEHQAPGVLQDERMVASRKLLQALAT